MYTKLFSSITDSTIWREPDHIRLVWITMLAKCDKNGMVYASIPGLSDASRVSLELCIEALTRLESPDEWSRSKDEDGRRILTVDGGWHLVNHQKYKLIKDADERKEYIRLKVKEYREKEKGVNNVNKSKQCKHIISYQIKPDQTIPNKEETTTNGFSKFWEIYPKCTQKLVCQRLWKLNVTDRKIEEKLFSVLSVQMKSHDWTKEGGKYAPSSKTYLEGACWEDKNISVGIQKRQTMAELEAKGEL